VLSYLIENKEGKPPAGGGPSVPVGKRGGRIHLP